MNQESEAPRCPIRGHEHPLTCVKVHTQQGTGDVARTWECPGGRYRWFILEGRKLSPALRMNRPRWGWSKS